MLHGIMPMLMLSSPYYAENYICWHNRHRPNVMSLDSYIELLYSMIMRVSNLAKCCSYIVIKCNYSRMEETFSKYIYIPH